MNRNFTWTKGFFDRHYQLFENGLLKGSFQMEILGTEGTAVLDSKRFGFKNHGIFSNNAQILGENLQILGSITYDIWKGKSEIILSNGERFACQFDTWSSGWSITNFKDKQIYYKSSYTSGSIHSNTDDYLLLLAGIYIKEQFYNLILLIIFVALFVSVIL